LADRFAHTPLLDAIIHGRDECADLLSQRGAPLFAEPDNSRFAALLCEASARGDTGLVNRLLLFSKGLSPDVGDYDGRRAVHVATRADVMRVLLVHGASLNVTDRWGHTALDEARGRGCTEVLALIDPGNGGFL
jgi:ankyrin repeat protein